MKLYCYRNLHRDLWSIQANQRVIGHEDSVFIGDPEFRVRKGGQARARRDRKKNVHAFVVGAFERVVANVPFEIHQDPESPFRWRQVTYNPFVDDSFVELPWRTPIEKADVALLTTEGRCFAGWRRAR